MSSYGFDGVGDGMSGTGGNDHPLHQLPAGLLFGAYCAIILLAGVAVVGGRDVNA